MIIRATFVTAVLLAAVGGARAQGADSPPVLPGDLAVSVYGPTSGGITWQRASDDRGVRGYEITRDGVVLGVRDTLSYVAGDLAPGRVYDFAVVAIDSAGQRSRHISTRIETPDARPVAPIGLAVNVRSATAADILWTPSAVSGERYEIKRDGKLVASAMDGRRYADTNLSAERSYLFEVIAVNRQGERSAPARLFVDTAAGTVADTPADTSAGSAASPPAAASNPAAPRGLRPVVYSSTAGAIAWDRAAEPGLRYEVSLDGRVVATTSGTSYVNKNLMRGRSHDLAVIAIDDQGARSAAATVALVTPGDGSSGSESTAEPDAATDTGSTPPAVAGPTDSATIIGVGNREEILARLLEVIGGEVYRDAFSLVDDVLFGEAGKTRVSEERGAGGEFVRVFRCDEGGSFETVAAASGQIMRSASVALDCRLGGTVFDGSTGAMSDSSNGTESLDTDLMITRPSGEEIVLTGMRTIDTSRADLFSTRTIDMTRYASSGPSGRLSIEGARSVVSWDRPVDANPTQSAEFSARVSAPWTGGAALDIRTDKRFEIPVPPGIASDGTTYTRGLLVARAADGSQLDLDTDNGDPASFTVTLKASGSTSAFTVAAGADTRIPCSDARALTNAGGTLPGCYLVLSGSDR